MHLAVLISRVFVRGFSELVRLQVKFCDRALLSFQAMTSRAALLQARVCFASSFQLFNTVCDVYRFV